MQARSQASWAGLTALRCPHSYASATPRAYRSPIETEVSRLHAPGGGSAPSWPPCAPLWLLVAGRRSMSPGLGAQDFGCCLFKSSDIHQSHLPSPWRLSTAADYQQALTCCSPCSGAVATAKADARLFDIQHQPHTHYKMERQDGIVSHDSGGGGGWVSSLAPTQLLHPWACFVGSSGRGRL